MKFFIVLLNCLICINSAQNTDTCEPCVCVVNIADCSRNTTGLSVTKLPQIGLKIDEITFEGQILESINNNTFSNVGNIKKLNLQNTKLNFVHRYSFKYMPLLNEIDLSYNEIETIDKNIFRYNEQLQKIRMDHNNLIKIKEGQFVNQKVLTHLYLQNNFIPNLTKNAFPNHSALKLLNLTQNKITFIDSTIIQNSDLTEVYLDDNNFTCDCHLKPFYEVMKAKQFNGINSKCNEPNSLKNQALIDLSASDFTCSINISSKHNTILTHSNNITLQCTVQAEAQPYVKWSFANNMIFATSKYVLSNEKKAPNSYEYSLTINNLTNNDTGQYYCTAKNTGFENTSYTNLTVAVAVKPIILFPKRDYIVVDLHEENYTIPFKIFGIPKPNVTWTYRDKILKSDTNTNKSVQCNESVAGGDIYWFNLTIKKVKLKYRTEFTCSAANSKGITNKSITLIILYPHNVAFEITNDYIHVNEMNNLTLICGVKAVPKPDILWTYGHLKIDSNIAPNKYILKQFRDDLGTYWSKLTILHIELFEGGVYKCEANNSETKEIKKFTVVVNKVEQENCNNDWTTTILIVIGCILLIILTIIIILKCCVRYYVSKNWTQEYSYRGSVMVN